MPPRIGTSGFSYQDWRGPFYPEDMPARAFLERYSADFDTVELNATYYRIPSLKSLAGMVARTPPGFVFTVKAHQDLTHHWGEQAERTLPVFRRALEPFAAGGKLGAVLLQFPFSFQPSPEAVAYVERLAGELAESSPVVEFRHRAWFTPERLEWLRARKLAVCCVDEPDLPNLLPPLALVTGPVAYVRFHGRNRAAWWDSGAPRDPGARYDYLYDEKELAEWAPRVRAMAGAAERVYVYFNNHPGGKAVQNAREFRALLAGEE